MTEILRVVAPHDERGNDANDFRGDPEYLSRLLESPKPNGKSEPTPTAKTLTGAFRYLEHRTTKQGRLVLDFVHVETGQTVSRFFNVDIQNPRTKKKYRVGYGGQFTTRPGHYFRKFWNGIFEQEPRRWCRAHTELHKLKNIDFYGIATQASSYWKLENIKKC